MMTPISSRPVTPAYCRKSCMSVPLPWSCSLQHHSVIEPVKRCDGTARNRTPPAEASPASFLHALHLLPRVFLKLRKQVVLEQVAPEQESPIQHSEKTEYPRTETDDGTRHSRIRAAKQRTRDAGGKFRNDLGLRVRGGEFQSKQTGH